MACKLYLNKVAIKRPNLSIGSFSKKQVGSELKADPLVSFFLCGKNKGTFSPLVET